MLRKIICFVSAILLTYSFSHAFAFNKLDTPTNLRWNGNIAQWDAVPDAGSYSLFVSISLAGSSTSHGLITSTNTTYYDCTEAFKSASNSMEISQGTLYATFTVRANTKNYETTYSSDLSTPSPQITYQLVAEKEKLATPVNLRWEGTKAVWDEVPNVSYYSFWLKSTREGSDSYTSLITSSRVAYYDCANALKDAGNSMGMTEGTIHATFYVTAHTNDYDHYLSSNQSDFSPQLTFELPVRERLSTPVNLHWEGTKAVWDEVPNAKSYSFFLKTQNTSLSTSSRTNTFECLDEMIRMANSSGQLGEFLVFSFSVKAYSNDRDLYIDSYTSAISPNIYINPITKSELPGDIDIDGSIGLSDAVLVLDTLSKGTASESMQAVADVDDNGKLDVHDALLLLQYTSGWNVSLK